MSLFSSYETMSPIDSGPGLMSSFNLNEYFNYIFFEECHREV